MRFLAILKSDLFADAGTLPSPEAIAEMERFNEEQAKAGVLLAAEGLHPSDAGVRLKFSGGQVTVTDGPFAEAKELIGGFWMLQVKSKEEAIEWVKRAPLGGGTEIEIRQVFEMDEFGDAFTPERRERRDQLRAEYEK